MRSVHLFVVLGTAVVGVAYLIFSSGPSRPKPTVAVAARSSDLSSDLVIGKPVVWQNLTIFPVSSKTPRQSDRFITLDEGLRAGTVEIFERGAAASGSRRPSEDPFAAPQTPLANSSTDPFGTPAAEQPASRQPVTSAANDPFAAPAEQPATAAQSDVAITASTQHGPNQELSVGNSVNELMVINRSEKPLYLMPGEIIIGGDQDRTIGQELVIAPDNKPVAIDVFCVEHGRWGGRGEQQYASILAAQATTGEESTIRPFSANLSLIVSQTTEAANSGKFVGSVGSLNMAARMAVQNGDGQGKVWEEVAKENAKGGVKAESGTFAGNYAEEEAIQRLKPFLRQLHKPIDETQNVVGVIVAVNGETASLDVFESTPLFRKLWPKLLKSYALDASNSADNIQANKQVTRNEALAFFHEAAQAHAIKTDTEGDLALSQLESDRVLLFSVHERRNQDVGGPAAIGGYGGMGGGAFGGAIHSSGFAK